MTNHTPGPWKHNDTWGLIQYGKQEICALHSGNEANARLIAAAPEMIAMLKHLISLDSDDMDNLESLKESARELIAKAEAL